MNKYPEWISSYDEKISDYNIVDIDAGGSYNDDFEEANKIAEQINGVVYTIIDSPDDKDIIYEKGVHWVNRIGVCVLKYVGGDLNGL